MDEARELEGLTAVVTGGNGGIGYGIARALGMAGARVALWARDPVKNRSAVDRLVGDGVPAAAWVCDVASEGAVEHAMQETVAELGPVDVMVANAGVNASAALVDMSLKQWNKVLATDLTGVFLCFRAAARGLLALDRPGALIAVASSAGLEAAPTMVGYAAAKAGILGLVRSAAVELATHRVRCNALLPGFTESSRMTMDTASASLLAETRAAIPAGRWAVPDELGAAARFLADPRLSYHTGDRLLVDGGYIPLPGYLAVRAAFARERVVTGD